MRATFDKCLCRYFIDLLFVNRQRNQIFTCKTFSMNLIILLYREILKKYLKRTITLQKKTIFQKFEKTIFRYSHKECCAKI